MRLSPTYSPAPGPSWWSSFIDSQRYRARLYLYNVRLVRIGGFLELFGVTVGILGLSGAVEAIRSGVDGVRLLSPPVISGLLVLALVTWGLARRRLGHLSRTFTASARTETLTEQLRCHMQKGMQNDAAFRALSGVYAPIIDHTNEEIASSGCERALQFVLDDAGKGPFLTAVLPAIEDESLEHLLERTLSPRSGAIGRRAASFADERQVFMRALRRIYPRPGADPADDERGDNLILQGVTMRPGSAPLELQAAVGTYGEIVRTSDSLLNEFALFAYLCRDRSDELGSVGRLAARLPGLRLGHTIELSSAATLKRLPWRRAVHRWCEQPSDLLLRPASRAAGLGVAVAMIQAEAEEPTAYVARRSHVVGTYPNVEHVIPAGMCNAKENLRAGTPVVREDFLKWTMLGELLEECYSVVELSGYETEDWVNHIKYHCRRRKVSTESPTFTGIAFDLLNLRPEVCAYRVVGTPGRSSRAVHAPRFTMNWEYSPAHGVRSIKLTELTTLCDRTDFVQSGVASLALALRSLEHRAEGSIEGQKC